MPQLPHFSLTIATPPAPASEPVTLAQVKQHLRVTVPDDDDYISTLLQAARLLIEKQTGRVLASTGFLLAFDRYPLLPNSQYSPGNPNVMVPVTQNTWPLDPSAWALILPRWPLLSVESVQYYDVSDTLQTLDPSAYVLDSLSEPPRLSPTSGSYWPAVSFRTGSVRVNFTAGYATPAAVPATAKHAIKLLVGHWYENREAAAMGKLDALPMALDALLSSLTPGYIW